MFDFHTAEDETDLGDVEEFNEGDEPLSDDDTGRIGSIRLRFAKLPPRETALWNFMVR